MSYDRSSALQEQHAAQQLVPPSPYARLRSVQSILRIWFPVIAAIALTIILAGYFLGMKWWYFPPILIVAYFFYRDFWRWRHNRFTCSPEDGILRIEDHGHPLVLFFINGSSDDQIPLGDIQLDTPTRGFMDRWIFHCDTLLVGDLKLRDVKDVEGLQAIQKYQESLKKQSIVLDQQQVDYGRASLETLESIGRDIGEMLELFRSAFGPSRMPTEQTHPIPVVRTPHPPEPISDDSEEEESDDES